eukprot:TRINITY_DN9133_c0_g1_i2.p1 TRINITY_DN9133_c0_g1~~TRINITY_DN9133_c0_g1_i2.p1  ORF type:complete len:304 (-),score=65.55 TRINITY_DN9133_c0_g1_i2:30-941(-)
MLPHFDDLIALGMLLCSPNRPLVATTLNQGDCYLEPSTEATQKLLTLLKATQGVSFARSSYEGTHPFPPEFRADSNGLPHLPSLQGIEPQIKCSDKPAARLIVDLLKAQKCDIVETGPLTNIADALDLDPTIAQNVNRLWVMGGALRTKGNVHNIEGHDGSAEWNIYNNAQAAHKVVAAGIPITLFTLDITDYFPLDGSFLKKLEGQLEYPLSRFAYEGWGLVLRNCDQEYYLWDTLTALGYFRPELFDYEVEKIRFVGEGLSEGRSELWEGGDPFGFFEVLVPIMKVPREAIEEALLLSLRK